MGLRDWYNKFVRKRDEFSAVEEQDRIQSRIQEKKLSADERELNKFLEKERQRQVKEMLESYRKQEQEEIWHGKTALDTPNVITNQKNLFGGQKNMFGWKSNNLKSGGMFWK